MSRSRLEPVRRQRSVCLFCSVTICVETARRELHAAGQDTCSDVAEGYEQMM